METEVKYYHKNSDIVAFEKIRYLDNYIREFTYDDKGNELTCKDSNGYISEYTYDDKGNVITLKDSDGYSSEFTYDDKGNMLTRKDSDGYYEIKGEGVTKEEFETFTKRPRVGQKVIVDGVEYRLK